MNKSQIIIYHGRPLFRRRHVHIVKRYRTQTYLSFIDIDEFVLFKHFSGVSKELTRDLFSLSPKRRFAQVKLRGKMEVEFGLNLL